MSNLVGWFALGVSALSAAASWTSFLASRRSGAKDKTAKIEMADYVRRMTEAMERRVQLMGSDSPRSPAALNGSVVAEFENGQVSITSDTEWIIDNLNPARWRLRNLGADAHDVEIDRSNLDVESVKIEGDLSVVPRMGAVDIKIQTRWKVPLPNELLVRWREHPNAVGVRLPKWHLG